MIHLDLVYDFVGKLKRAYIIARSPNVTVTSWYRSPQENQRVGGAARSQHLLGLAIDVLPDRGGAAFAQAAQAQGMTILNEGDHFHIQAFPAGVLPETFWT